MVKNCKEKKKLTTNANGIMAIRCGDDVKSEFCCNDLSAGFDYLFVVIFADYENQRKRLVFNACIHNISMYSYAWKLYILTQIHVYICATTFPTFADSALTAI